MLNIEDLFDPRLDFRDIEGDPIEDRQILNPDGSRACILWELRGNRYSLVNPNEDPYSVM
jgi:hypothetical protein